MILRPSIVFGPEDDFFNRFGALARIAPALPLIGGGHTKLEPVYAGDVAKAVVASLTGKAAAPAPYELGGPEMVTLKEVMARVLDYTMRRRLLVPIPFWLAKLQGRRPAALALAAAHHRPGAAAGDRQRGERGGASAPAARSKASASSRSRSRRWCRIISSASARAASSRCGARERARARQV